MATMLSGYMVVSDYPGTSTMTVQVERNGMVKFTIAEWGESVSIKFGPEEIYEISEILHELAEEADGISEECDSDSDSDSSES